MSSYFLIHVYGPCALIVIISWMSFLLPRSSPPARVTLGVTSVLTVVTILNMLNNSMPKVITHSPLVGLQPRHSDLFRPKVKREVLGRRLGKLDLSVSICRKKSAMLDFFLFSCRKIIKGLELTRNKPFPVQGVPL